MYSVLLAEYDPKTPNNPDSKDPKKKHDIQKAKDIKKSSEIFPREAEERAMKAKLHVKTFTVKKFSKEEAYTKRLENYRKRYKDNDLYSSLEKLYKLYYHIAKEENHERSDDKIEQMLKAMAI
ncbi:30084_t:CDS:2 [Gigaspora margarita]|uniref:30084_t:CDS:1 n=1 Tax=Gigaspora margarita TaxID=4874 RepID=A0ABN7WMD8_GIGMA|nr:30084_t:CDS:2 [Gigaspora margarita]